MSGRTPRVLILTASYGSGHNRVAAALAHAFRAKGALPRVFDHFESFVSPVFNRATQALYLATLRRAPALWGAAYWLSDHLPVWSPLLLGMNRLGMRRLARAIEADRPDLVVTVHPTPAGALSELKRRGFPCPPHATVFTDFVVHTQWIYPHVDWYCVPTEEIRIGLERRGVPSERIVVSGIPIAPEFSSPPHLLRARKLLQLDHEPFAVLLMAGAQGGLGRLGSALSALRALAPPVQITVVCGTDGMLADRLRGRWSERAGVRILGYVQAIHLEMVAADLLITKAGAVTLAEAFALDLPVVCYGSLPGQEARNQRAIEMSGAALVARTPSGLRETVELLRSDPRLLQKLKSNAAVLRHPHAAQTVARQLLVAVGHRTALRS